METNQPLSGIDFQWIDESIRPQDDLFGHVNGKWLQTHQIPDDRASDGALFQLRDEAEEHVRAIVEDAKNLDGQNANLIANLYESFMDTQQIESLGILPVQGLFMEIADIANSAQLAATLGRMQRLGLAKLFRRYINQDAKNSNRYLLHISQSGLGLPDETYYRENAHQQIRIEYVEYLAQLAELFQLNDPKGIADSVMALETDIAAVSWDRVANRDVEKTYTLMTLQQLHEHAPEFGWNQWMNGLGVKQNSVNELVVRQPSFVSEVAKLWAKHPLEQWKMWLTIRVAASCAPYLNDEIVQANFAFYGRTLSGTQQLRERWRRGVSLVENAVGEAIGCIYVERHFPSSAKQHVAVLVDNLISAYRKSIESLEWMSAPTRNRAIEKLEAFVPKIGYPNKWKDYSSLELHGDDLLGNVLQANEWETDQQLAKLGKPIDRDEWFMTPQMVNAYYSQQMNEIVFPAAILQPPLFNPDADDAVNYGGIGAVIGHEIGHGFDDQGSRYDGEGNLVNWWTDEDRSEFQKRAQMLIEQFNQLSPTAAPEHKVNGALTVGENIGDLGGLTIAIKAYELSLNGNESPVINGLTGIQRVFFGWAQCWRWISREAEAIRLLSIDPHSPAELRCNAIVRNISAFYDAFNVQPADDLFIPEDQRVSIW